jgi:hypothetical protein
LLRGVLASKIPGTPVYVEINFRRFKKVTLVRLKSLKHSADDEEDALTRGSLYSRQCAREVVQRGLRVGTLCARAT